MHNKEKFIVVTPVRNEEKHIVHTICSMLKQKVLPSEWIIVNDGSKDSTGHIINYYSSLYKWIKPLHLKDRGFRKSGGGVVDAFYAGYNLITEKNWDYLVKLDGDLSFEPEYFRICFDHFIYEPKLGITGGYIYNKINGKISLEKQPKFHVRGATKIYRRKCWHDIKGLKNAPGWDTLDEVKANMLGWKTYSIDKLKIVHYRQTGAADGYWKTNQKYGIANYICGYHPLFVFLKMIKKVFQKPYIVSSLAYFIGFSKGHNKKIKRTLDKDLMIYLRKQQLRRIFFMKSIWY